MRHREAHPLHLRDDGEGGAAPPVATATGSVEARFTVSGAWISMVSTTGAPHIWVTPCSRYGGEDHRRLDAAQADMRAALQR